MANLIYSTPEEWHEIRKRHVGSSEVSALFGLHPFGLTRWQLWHHKRGTLADDLDTTSTRQGQHFEPAIAAYAQEKFGIRLRKVRRYLSHDTCQGLGASIDYEEYGNGALIPTELKWSVWGSDWDYTGDDLTVAPDAYILQVQHQLACSGAPHGQLLAFTGGDLRRMIIPRSEKIISAISSMVETFWHDVREGNEPPVDFAKDSSAITDLAYRTPLREVTLPPAHADKFAAWHVAKAEARKWAESAEALQGECIKLFLDNAPLGNDGKAIATCGNYRLSLTQVNANPGKIIDASMVGQTIGARKGFLRTTLKKED